MDTIDTFLDAMFAPYPTTPRLVDAKRELRAMMEDAYVDAVGAGRSHNEAVGQVISDFGNLEELAPAQAMKDADAFYQRLSSRMERRYLVDASQTEKERKRLEARNQEIDGMFLSLYTDKAKGVLTEQRFMKLTAALEQEQEANQKRLHDLALMKSRADAQESEVRTFIKEIRRYAAIEELDEAVLNRLISKILIGEVKKVDGQKVQEVKIVYNFVGEIPEIAA